jgi:hypothetical protein
MADALRERNKGPTARNYAEGNLSGPSAQHKNKVDKQDRHRHIIVVGIGRAVPTAAVGTAYADGLAVGTDFFIYNHDRAVPTAAVGTVYADG